MTSSIQAGSGSRPAMSSGSRMFSTAVRVGTRLKAWKMKPTRSRRTMVICFSDSPLNSTSPIHVSPDVSRSRPAMHCISVDLPDPEGPMIAVKAPVANSTSIPSIARTSLSPWP